VVRYCRKKISKNRRHPDQSLEFGNTNTFTSQCHPQN
jgi:hypothetical protein